MSRVSQWIKWRTCIYGRMLHKKTTTVRHIHSWISLQCFHPAPRQTLYVYMQLPLGQMVVVWWKQRSSGNGRHREALPPSVTRPLATFNSSVYRLGGNRTWLGGLKTVVIATLALVSVARATRRRVEHSIVVFYWIHILIPRIGLVLGNTVVSVAVLFVCSSE